MRWLDDPVGPELRPQAKAVLLRQAVESRDRSPLLRFELGKALMQLGAFDEAAVAFKAAWALDELGFQGWTQLATCYQELGLPEQTLEACRAADAHGHIGMIHTRRGDALRMLGRGDEADLSYLAALTGDMGWLAALTALFRPMASEPDGARMLGFVDALPDRCVGSALARAHRAIALSRLGRTEEAQRIVDLEQHVMRVPFEASSSDTVAALNSALARDIQADPSPIVDRADFNINYAPAVRASPAFAKLRGFIRASFETYIDELPARGLDSLMPPPAAGSLVEAGVVLRGSGRNGQHVHGTGYLSGVYHVAVPEDVATASDARGALTLGCCDEHTGGYVPCWGTRYITPVAGWLIIFPSHIFHDVVPPGTSEPRISIAVDLRPA